MCTCHQHHHSSTNARRCTRSSTCARQAAFRPPTRARAPATPQERKSSKAKGADRLVSQEGVELGPIGMTFGGVASTSGRDEAAAAGGVHIPSISKMSTEEWRAKYEKDGTVDLWVEEEFNSGSRLIVSVCGGAAQRPRAAAHKGWARGGEEGRTPLGRPCPPALPPGWQRAAAWSFMGMLLTRAPGFARQGGRAVHYGDTAGFRTGEGRTAGNVASHKVKIYNHYAEQHLEIDVPEDRWARGSLARNQLHS